MNSNVSDAMGELIRQQAKAQLARDWEKAEAEIAARRARFARIRAFFNRPAGVSKMNFQASVLRVVRA